MIMLVFLITILLILPLGSSQSLSLYVDPLITTDNNYTGNNSYKSLSSAFAVANTLRKQTTIFLAQQRDHEISTELNISTAITIKPNLSEASLKLTGRGKLSVVNSQILVLQGITMGIRDSNLIFVDRNANLVFENTIIKFLGAGNQLLKCLGNSSLTIINSEIRDYESVLSQPLCELSSVRLASIKGLNVQNVSLVAGSLFSIYGMGSKRLEINSTTVLNSKFWQFLAVDSFEEIVVNSLQISLSTCFGSCLLVLNSLNTTISELGVSANNWIGSILIYRDGRKLILESSTIRVNIFVIEGENASPFEIELPYVRLIIRNITVEGNENVESSFFQLSSKLRKTGFDIEEYLIRDLTLFNNTATKLSLQFFFVAIEVMTLSEYIGLLNIKNCIFRSNNYFGTLWVFQRMKLIDIWLSDIQIIDSYIQNSDHLILLRNSNITLISGKFQINSGLLLNMRSSVASLSFSYFIINEPGSKAQPEINIAQNSELTFSNVNIKSSNPLTLRVDVFWDSQINLLDTAFESGEVQATWLYPSGLSLLICSKSIINIQRTKFIGIFNNNSLERAIVTLINSNEETNSFSDIDFINCSIRGSFFQYSDSLIQMENINISSRSLDSSPIIISQDSEVNIQFFILSVKNQFQTLDAPLIHVLASTFTISNFSISNITLNRNCEALIHSTMSDLNISKANFQNLIAKDNQSSVIFAGSAKNYFIITDSIFYNNSNVTQVKGLEIYSLLVSNCVIYNILGQVLSLRVVNNLTLTLVNVSHIYAFLPAIEIEVDPNILKDVRNSVFKTTIYKSTFFHCLKGGISVKNSNLTISQSDFIMNSATKGAGLFFSCSFPLLEILQWQINDSNFISNQAEEAGAAFFWENLPPYSDMNNLFLNNTLVNQSNEYQSNRSSNPVKLKLTNNFLEQSIDTSYLRAGFKLELLDAYNNVCSYYSDNELLLWLNSSSLLLNKRILSSHAFYSKQGTWTISNLIIKLEKGNSTQLMFSTESVENYLQNAIKFEAEIQPAAASHYQIEGTQEYSYILNIKSRFCLTGELITETGCQMCPQGTYSIQKVSNSKDSSSPCLICPKNAFCPGGSSIMVDQGFWRLDNNNSTVNIFECTLLSSACVGGAGTADALCAPGYSGPLCSVCVYNSTVKFYKNYYQECANCSSSDHPISIIIALLLTSGLLIQVLFSIKESYNRLQGGGTPAFAFLSYMLLSYFQMVFLLNEVEIPTPSFFKHLSRYLSFINNFHNISRYADCSFSDAAFKRDIPIFLIKNIVGNILLIFLFFLTYIMTWIIYKFYGKSSFRNISFLGFSIIPQVALYKALFIPMLTFYLKTFYCISVGENSYLGNDLGLVCWGKNHVAMIVLSIFSALACLVLPIVLALLLLIRNRKNFFKIGIREQVILIIIGFKKSFFYWEFINASKKILIVVVIIFANSDAVLLGLLLLLVTLCYNVILVMVNPYESKNLYYLDFMQGVTIFITISGMLYFTNAEVIVEHVLIILLIFLMNICFLGFNIFLIMRYFKFMKRQRVINEAKKGAKTDQREDVNSRYQEQQRGRNVPIYQSDGN